MSVLHFFVHFIFSNFAVEFYKYRHFLQSDTQNSTPQPHKVMYICLPIPSEPIISIYFIILLIYHTKVCQFLHELRKEWPHHVQIAYTNMEFVCLSHPLGKLDLFNQNYQIYDFYGILSLYMRIREIEGYSCLEREYKMGLMQYRWVSWLS